jgi:hypothetical protein
MATDQSGRGPSGWGQNSFTIRPAEGHQPEPGLAPSGLLGAELTLSPKMACLSLASLYSYMT